LEESLRRPLKISKKKAKSDRTTMPSTSGDSLYAFGPFTADSLHRRLFRGSDPIPLTPKAFEILLAFLESPARLLTKEQLMARVWGDTVVEDANLTQNLSVLRKALGERPSDRQFIVTVPGSGYRFVAPVERVPRDGQTAAALLDAGGRVIPERPAGERLPAPAAIRRGRTSLVAAAAIVAVATAIAYVRISGSYEARAQADAAYRRGRALWNTRRGADLQQSILAYQEALRYDPRFALAYAGLADAHAFDLIKWKDAEGEARRAIELDRNLAQPHATLGFIALFHRWQWLEAEREFQQAIVLDPAYATARQWYAIQFASLGRFPEAFAQIERAVALDPKSLPIRADLGQLRYFAGDYPGAAAACRESLALDPTFVNAHEYLSDIYVAQGQNERAVEEFFIASRAAAGAPSPWEDRLRRAFQAGGIRGFWEANLDRLRDQNGRPDPYTVAQYLARIGDASGALANLETAIGDHHFSLVYLWVDPAFRPIRPDDRFLRLVRRIGLPLHDPKR
jgi:DNA-binding winged helix-turn-helix (wHTH) protein/Tfp pilus assembly protein PilF